MLDPGSPEALAALVLRECPPHATMEVEKMIEGVGSFRVMLSRH